MWKDYFYFSKKEAKSIYILVFIMTLFWGIPYLFHSFFFNVTKNIGIKNNEIVINKPIDSFIKKNVESTILYKEFNPNTLDSMGWISFNIPPKTIHTILNFVRKTKGFKIPEDLLKIYGMPVDKATALIPYIRLQNNLNHHSIIVSKNNAIQQKKLWLEMNTVNAYQLINYLNLPKDIAFKIIKYREALNGFVSILQIKKTYTITDSIFQAMLPFIYLDNAKIKLIPINEAKTIHYLSLNIFTKEESYKFIGFKNKIEKINDWTILQNISWVTQNQLDTLRKYFVLE